MSTHINKENRHLLALSNNELVTHIIEGQRVQHQLNQELRGGPIWGLSKLTAEQRRDLLEILEDRHQQRSTIVTSQLPIEKWHGMIGDPTLADAILDRLIHNAHKLPLKGESMRKQQSELTPTTNSE